jgi:hypothetical protein
MFRHQERPAAAAAAAARLRLLASVLKCGDEFLQTKQMSVPKKQTAGKGSMLLRWQQQPAVISSSVLASWGIAMARALDVLFTTGTTGMTRGGGVSPVRSQASE